MFLDPPYSHDDRADVYTHEDYDVAHDVREWAIQWGDDPRMRICLAGYEGEYDMPSGWTVHEWKAKGGYESQGAEDAVNCHLERLWFSPHCLKTEKQLTLAFASEEE